jgi:deazaflavin-dependent oxidoreductase (nitroreductase family)
MPSRNPIRRLVNTVASSALGARIFSVLLHPLDGLVHKLSGGKHSLTGLVTGLPVYVLTSTGAKSGLKRQVTLLGVADGENVILIASNWGQTRYPAWYHNLKAHPRATLTYRGETSAHIAHEATGAERAAAWQRAVALYPGYDNYVARTGGRVIPVMVLSPAES